VQGSFDSRSVASLLRASLRMTSETGTVRRTKKKVAQEGK
jgi:hypothetical protein